MSQVVIHYQPTCDLKAMRARAQMYSQIPVPLRQHLPEKHRRTPVQAVGAV